MSLHRFASSSIVSILCFLVPATLATAGLGIVACTSTPSPVGPTPDDAGADAHLPDAAPDHAAPDAGDDAGQPTADCGAIVLLPALITVLTPATATGPAHPCDATFALIDLPDGGSSGASLGATPCNQSPAPAGCPSIGGGAADASTDDCTYALLALQTTSAPVSVEVSESGFQSALATGVKSGAGGCVPNVAPSDVTVELEPVVADAGADGH